MIRARGVRPGAKVALVAPAGPLPEGAIDRATARVRDLGWEPVVGPNAGRRLGYLAGSDEQRLADLTNALAAADNDAIWCLRGGYGTMRLLARLDLEPLRQRPRPLIGFSDNTVLHLAARREGIVTFHGPHAAVPELPSFSMDLLRRLVESDEPAGILPFPADAAPAESVVDGVAVGPLVGGNLALLAATAGTEYQLQARGAIICIEDVGEPAYRIDRMLSQLLLAGVFEGIEGVAAGAFSECPDAGTPGMPSPADVIRDRLAPLGVPIGYGFPFGHVNESWTLPLGVLARLDATEGTLEFLEPGVTR